jgi:hypothetical protein
MKVLELLSSEDKWTQGAFARNKDGVRTDYYAEKAVSWCLIGAIHKCYSDYEEINSIMNRILFTVGEKCYQYNDTHTYEEVMELIRELDI